jgi:hypothetical protein
VDWKLPRKGQLINSDLTAARVNRGGWPRPASDVLVFGLTADGTRQVGELIPAL